VLCAVGLEDLLHHGEVGGLNVDDHVLRLLLLHDPGQLVLLPDTDGLDHCPISSQTNQTA
jgi:hypothetical protein